MQDGNSKFRLIAAYHSRANRINSDVVLRQSDGCERSLQPLKQAKLRQCEHTVPSTCPLLFATWAYSEARANGANPEEAAGLAAYEIWAPPGMSKSDLDAMEKRYRDTVENAAKLCRGIGNPEDFEGLIWDRVFCKEGKTGSIGIVNWESTTAIQTSTDNLMETKDNSHWLIRAGIRGRMGLNSLVGKQLVPQIFDWTISGFGWASCSLDDQVVIVDSSGVIIRRVYGVDSYSPISDGMLSITDASTDKEGYLSIDSSTNDIECNFRTCRNFHRGVAAVEQYTGHQTSRWGLIDKSGEFVIPPTNLDIGDFKDSCDVAPHLPDKEKRDEKVWGLINRRNK